jgi:hypothetical protein
MDCRARAGAVMTRIGVSNISFSRACSASWGTACYLHKHPQGEFLQAPTATLDIGRFALNALPCWPSQALSVTRRRTAGSPVNLGRLVMSRYRLGDYAGHLAWR